MIVIITDPHLGTHRVANTTVLSRANLRSKLFSTARNALMQFSGRHVTKLIAGDLFNSDSNDERTILEGFKLAQMCDVVLAGNHDLPNRVNAVSSLQLVDELTGKDGTVVIAPVDGVLVEQGAAKCGTNMTLIPHHATQGLFDDAIQFAIDNPIGGLVITHCNFDSERASDDASLNITRVQAQSLFDAGYEYILNGHEHGSSTHMGGKFVNLGNTHPTSMGDISEKFLWTYDKTAGLSKHCIWSMEKYAEITVSDDNLVAPETEAEFIDVVGVVSPENGPAVAELLRKLHGAPTALAVRNRVTYTTDILDVESTGTVMIHDLSEQITAELMDSDLLPLWNKYKGECA